jgi:hypothetical protein
MSSFSPLSDSCDGCRLVGTPLLAFSVLGYGIEAQRFGTALYLMSLLTRVCHYVLSGLFTAGLSRAKSVCMAGTRTSWISLLMARGFQWPGQQPTELGERADSSGRVPGRRCLRHARCFREAAKVSIPYICILVEQNVVCSQTVTRCGMINVVVVPQVGHCVVR